MKTTIQFQNVSKHYNLGLTRTSAPALISRFVKRAFGRLPEETAETKSLWALRDVSFELKQGQSLALLGPNGAGKTTILKLLANITKPTSGQLNVNGQLSALIELGAGFHPDLTGAENIYLNGTILGLSRKYIAERFDEIVAFSEIGRFIDTPVKRYSSGMKVRLGFAVASCIEPKILLVDEVLAVGDASFREKCMNRIEELINSGTSIIFVSHNLYLVRSVCDQALYIDQGQIKDRGQTEDVIRTYEKSLHEQRAKNFKQNPTKQFDKSSADIEITKVEVLGVNDQEQEEFWSDQPAKLNIHYIAHQNVGPISVAAHITRSDGLTCCMMRTSLDKVQFSLDRGQGVISVTLDPLQLVGNTYFAEGHFLNGSDSMKLVSGRSDWFSVKGKSLSYEARSGVFVPHTTTWSQTSSVADSAAKSEQVPQASNLVHPT